MTGWTNGTTVHRVQPPFADSVGWWRQKNNRTSKSNSQLWTFSGQTGHRKDRHHAACDVESLGWCAISRRRSMSPSIKVERRPRYCPASHSHAWVQSSSYDVRPSRYSLRQDQRRTSDSCPVARNRAKKIDCNSLWFPRGCNRLIYTHHRLPRSCTEEVCSLSSTLPYNLNA